jgi:hypothetical protein
MQNQTIDQERERLSYRVVEAIADAMDTDVIDLEPPLYSVIDPDALELVFAGSQSVAVRFKYNEQIISVDADRTITIDDMVYD